MASRRLPPPAVLLLALLVPLSTLLPVWQAHQAASPPAKNFLGFRYMAGDHYQYAAFVRQARDDASLLMRDPFTTEPQKGCFVLLFFWALGRLSWMTGLPVTAVWDLSRLIGGALFIITFWYLSAAWFGSHKTRLMAVVLFSLGGGLGWLAMLARQAAGPLVEPLLYPFDYFWNWSTFGTMALPNWIWPALLMMLTVHANLAKFRGRAALTFLVPPIVWFAHGYTGLVCYGILGLLPLMPLIRAALRLEPLPWDRASSNLRVALPGLLSFGVVAAHILYSRTDGVFRAVSAHGFAWTDNFSIWWYPLGYGLLLLPAWWGFRLLGAEQSLATDLLMCWATAAFALSINHFFAGVKFQYLLFMPIAVFAAKGLERVNLTFTSAAAWRGRPLRVGLLLAALLLDAPVSLVKEMPATADDADIFISSDEKEAMAFLDGQPDGVVLSSYRSGNRIPWLAGKPVYVGHWFMTIKASEKGVETAQFYKPQVPPDVKRSILARSGARYVYYGAAEARLGRVEPALPLRKIFEKGEVAVYAVDSERIFAP